MDELDKALGTGLRGPERDAAVAEMEGIVESWGIRLPPSEKLVSDFGLDEFRRVGLVESWVANETDAGYCGKFLFVFDGQTCPMHHHRTKHETFYVVHGEVLMCFDGTTCRMGAGQVLPVPPGKKHSFTGVGPALLLEVSKTCVVDDNYFEDTRIPIGGNYRPQGVAHDPE